MINKALLASQKFVFNLWADPFFWVFLLFSLTHSTAHSSTILLEKEIADLGEGLLSVTYVEEKNEYIAIYGAYNSRDKVYDFSDGKILEAGSFIQLESFSMPLTATRMLDVSWRSGKVLLEINSSDAGVLDPWTGSLTHQAEGLAENYDDLIFGDKDSQLIGRRNQSPNYVVFDFIQSSNGEVVSSLQWNDSITNPSFRISRDGSHLLAVEHMSRFSIAKKFDLVNNLSIDQALPFLGADLQFTPDGSKLLEVGSAPFQKPVALYIYDIANGELIKTVEILGDTLGPANEIYGEDFPFYISRNSHYLTTFYKGKAILVDLESLEVVAIAESEISEFGHQIGYVSDNGKTIILVQKSGKVMRASFAEGTPIQSTIKLSGDSWLIQYSSATGTHYRIEKSQDLEKWTLLENVLEGNGEKQEFSVDNDKERSLFFRVLELL